MVRVPQPRMQRHANLMYVYMYIINRSGNIYVHFWLVIISMTMIIGVCLPQHLTHIIYMFVNNNKGGVYRWPMKIVRRGGVHMQVETEY